MVFPQKPSAKYSLQLPPTKFPNSFFAKAAFKGFKNISYGANLLSSERCLIAAHKLCRTVKLLLCKVLRRSKSRNESDRDNGAGINRRALDGCGDEPKLRTEKITSSHANTDMNQHKTPRTRQNRTKREQHRFCHAKLTFRTCSLPISVCVSILVTGTGHVTVVLALFGPLLNC